METALVIYGISILGGFRNMLDSFVVFSLLAALVCFAIKAFFTLNSIDKKEEQIGVKAGKVANVYLIAGVCFAFVHALIPSERSMWLIAGGYVAQEAVTSEIGQDVVEIIKRKVSEYKQEMIEGAK